MSNVCAACGWSGEKNGIVGKDKKRNFEKCGACGDVFCDDCLAQMHRDHATISEADLAHIVGSGQSLLVRDEESGEDVCPDCQPK